MEENGHSRFFEHPDVAARVSEGSRAIAIVIALPAHCSQYASEHHARKIQQRLHGMGYAFTIDLINVKEVEEATLAERSHDVQ